LARHYGPVSVRLQRVGVSMVARQAYGPWPLAIDPIIPRAYGGSDAEDNLWLVCRACQLCTGQQIHGCDPRTGRRVRLFHPRRQRWRRHLQWPQDGVGILGRMATDRATVVALSLNNLVAVTVRRTWVMVGWYPPPD